MTFAALCAIVVSIAMIGKWALTLIKRQVPGPEAGPTVGRGPVEMLFHKIAELVTAIARLAGGVGLLLGCTWGRQSVLNIDGDAAVHSDQQLRILCPETGMVHGRSVCSYPHFRPRQPWPGSLNIASLTAVAADCNVEPVVESVFASGLLHTSWLHRSHFCHE